MRQPKVKYRLLWLTLSIAVATLVTLLWVGATSSSAEWHDPVGRDVEPPSGVDVVATYSPDLFTSVEAVRSKTVATSENLTSPKPTTSKLWTLPSDWALPEACRFLPKASGASDSKKRACLDRVAPSEGIPFPIAERSIEERLQDLRKWTGGWRDETILSKAGIKLEHGMKFSADGSLLPPLEYCDNAIRVHHKHTEQTARSFYELKERWKRNTFGEVHVSDLLRLTHFTADMSDGLLWYTSQFIHSLQVYASIVHDSHKLIMEGGKSYYYNMLLTALIHDLGKVLSILGEEDHNAECPNYLLCRPPRNTGLLSDHIIQSYSHDEYAYAKLAPYLSSTYVKLAIRFHSSDTIKKKKHPSQAEETHRVALENAAEDDVELEALDFVRKFREYDTKTKICTPTIPTGINWVDIEDLLANSFPNGGRVVW